ncbi:unnamed protein product, partial [Nippostrongylus brasiliensis]|uniref:Uncharacterized protein n=1 Tax=Nippostrongylus brasiliensis TaxID=27835 RepID=A0A0N4YX69_NIPBR
MMSKPATQSVTCDSPERTFSYADAAKKSSEPSRDNSPACVAVASPSAKSDSPAPQTPTPVAATVQENSAADGSGAAGGLSFFYDESEAAQYEGAEGNDMSSTINITPAQYRKYSVNGELRLSAGFFQRYFESSGTTTEVPILQVS